MSQTVYVVTAGDYSDFHIKEIFSSRELAEQFCSRFPSSSELNIREWGLDQGNECPQGMLRYCVSFDRDGKTTCEQVEPGRGYEEVRAYGDDVRMVTYCWARDEQHAIKIGNERRVQAIANGEWETDWNVWRKKFLSLKGEA